MKRRLYVVEACARGTWAPIDESAAPGVDVAKARARVWFAEYQESIPYRVVSYEPRDHMRDPGEPRPLLVLRRKRDR